MSPALHKEGVHEIRNIEDRPSQAYWYEVLHKESLLRLLPAFPRLQALAPPQGNRKLTTAHMKRLLVFAKVIALSLVLSALLSAQSNPQVGTWKLNPAKSKYATAQAPKSETRSVETEGDGAKVSFDGVAEDGSRIAYSYTTNYDGKESIVSGVGMLYGQDTIAVKRANENTTTAILRKLGKVVGTTRAVVSKDGKVTTITTKGTNEQGQQTSATTVWDKQ